MLCAFYQEAIHAHAVEEGVEGLGEGLKTLHVQCSHSAYEDKAKHTHTQADTHRWSGCANFFLKTSTHGNLAWWLPTVCLFIPKFFRSEVCQVLEMLESVPLACVHVRVTVETQTS